ncbi:MAG TPA: hypothetical protein VIL48_12745 [Acidimicrobiales bacterium]
MPAHDDEAAVEPPGGEDDPDAGVPGGPGGAARRDARIEELRAELQRLQARVAADIARQRRAAMKLQALLEEERHRARQARRQERVRRLRSRPEHTAGSEPTPDPVSDPPDPPQPPPG